MSRPMVVGLAWSLLFVWAVSGSSAYASESWSRELLTGKFSPSKESRFVKIDEEYANRPGMYLHREAYRAYQAMHHTAEAEGVRLRIISALRTFWHQKSIWESKWNAASFSRFKEEQRVSEIMKYSALPGLSRHHWGTEVDLNDLDNAYFEQGEGRLVYEWLMANAPRFGFYQTYTSDPGRTGYHEEKWHWSYFPISSGLVEQFVQKVTIDDLKGFAGDVYLPSLDIIDRYKRGVAPAPAHQLHR